jgi:hypothetical protein
MDAMGIFWSLKWQQFMMDGKPTTVTNVITLFVTFISRENLLELK